MPQPEIDHAKYMHQRALWRLKATKDLADACPSALQAAQEIQVACSHIALSMSGARWGSVPGGRYLVDLFISFLRTEVEVVDLALASELQDATTLHRKQLEAVARLIELTNGVDVMSLIGKTPNLNVLKSKARKLYGEYSEIAHSSHPAHGGLLGGGEAPSELLTSVYPKYTENTIVLIHNAVAIFGEFGIWCVDFFEGRDIPFPSDELKRSMAFMMELIPDLEKLLAS